eukprot:TRINITY_DN173_c0_g1_i3.p1 TRINITY_DN173_c0_g1~~TRINITY_DN173_c0_g1_i3.p1  ORF type:complete len:259 (+),score=56.24 TRINITY_DN173_c0_g1_i3:42-779(+)
MTVSHITKTSLKQISAAILLFIFLSISQANASHFYSGAITYRKLAPTTVEFTIRQVWLAEDVDNLQFFFGDGTSDLTANTFISAVNTTSNRELHVVERVISHTYASADRYVAYMEDCCRSTQIKNSPGTSYRVEAFVDITDPFDLGSPQIIAPPVVQLGISAASVYHLSTSDIDGDGVECRIAAAGESGIQIPPTVNGNALSVLKNCSILWDNQGASIGDLYGMIPPSFFGGSTNGTTLTSSFPG